MNENVSRFGPRFTSERGASRVAFLSARDESIVWNSANVNLSIDTRRIDFEASR